MPHPDYLLGRDSLDNYYERGLTGKQYQEWMLYISEYPLPHDRSDFNTASMRADRLQIAGSKVTADKLIPPYGKRSERKSLEQLKEIVNAHKGKPKKPSKGRKQVSRDKQ